MTTYTLVCVSSEGLVSSAEFSDKEIALDAKSIVLFGMTRAEAEALDEKNRANYESLRSHWDERHKGWRDSRPDWSQSPPRTCGCELKVCHPNDFQFKLPPTQHLAKPMRCVRLFEGREVVQ